MTQYDLKKEIDITNLIQRKYDLINIKRPTMYHLEAEGINKAFDAMVVKMANHIDLMIAEKLQPKKN
ncbi:MAG: hypothetical protein H7320_16930 [Ferruginibacter sp.]|nr:hypothetical protein [Ferruginibacter sp.]